MNKILVLLASLIRIVICGSTLGRNAAMIAYVLSALSTLIVRPEFYPNVILETANPVLITSNASVSVQSSFAET